MAIANLVRALKALHEQVQRGQWNEASESHKAFAALLANAANTKTTNAALHKVLPRICQRYSEIMILVSAENDRLATKLDELGQKREGWLAYGQISELNG
jgi:hypothetical protein